MQYTTTGSSNNIIITTPWTIETGSEVNEIQISLTHAKECTCFECVPSVPAKSERAERIRHTLADYLDFKITPEQFQMNEDRLYGLTRNDDIEAHELVMRLDLALIDYERGQCTKEGLRNALRRLLAPPTLQWVNPPVSFEPGEWMWPKGFHKRPLTDADGN